MVTVCATRIVSADRRGSSWPVLAETDGGVRFTKLRGAGQGTGALVAEVIVATLAERLGLDVPARSLVRFERGIESLDRDGELRTLLDASEGINLGFAYLDGARVLTAADVDKVNPDDAAAIVWLDGLAMNPDRTARNPNLMWWRNRLWLIDHGAALGFQYGWSSVSETSPTLPVPSIEPHLLRARAADLLAWDDILAARVTRDAVHDAVAQVPDDFLTPLLPAGAGIAEIDRRRAAYSAFLWKRLKAPRTWVGAGPTMTAPARRARPSWLAKD